MTRVRVVVGVYRQWNVIYWISCDFSVLIQVYNPKVSFYYFLSVWDFFFFDKGVQIYFVYTMYLSCLVYKFCESIVTFAVYIFRDKG